MKRWQIRGILIFVILGVASWGLKNAIFRKAPEHRENECLRLPVGTTMKDLFPEDLLAAMARPEVMRFHRIGGDEKVIVARIGFSSVDVTPDQKTRERMCLALTNPSSYQMIAACAFSPAILLHLERDGRSHDLVFCFDCETVLVRSEDDELRPGMGLSKNGARIFLRIFSEAFPDFQELSAKLRKTE